MRTLETSTLEEFAVKADTKPRISLPERVAAAKALASGRWPEIINRLTSIPDDYLTTRHRDCIKCGGKDRFRVYGDFEQTGGAICNQCGPKLGDGFKLIQWYFGIGFLESLQMVEDYLGISDDETISALPLASQPRITPEPTAVPKSQAQVNRIHEILESFQTYLGLDDDHREALKQRGFIDATIDASGYATLEPKRLGLAKIRLSQKFPSFDEIAPGFNRTGYCPPRGVLLAIRDRHRQIQGHQIRFDVVGKDDPKYKWLSGIVKAIAEVHHSSGCEIDHVEQLRLTEGSIKAELSHQITKIPCISCQGITTYERLFTAIEQIKPKLVRIAFDADYATNPAVANAIRGTAVWLQQHGYEFVIETWDPTHKGIDDALLAGTEIIEHRGDSANKMLVSLEKKPPEILIDPDDPAHLASENLTQYQLSGRDIKFWRDNWYLYKGRRWELKSEAYVRARLREFIERRFVSLAIEQTERYEDRIAKNEIDPEKVKRPKKLKVTGPIVRHALEALETLCLVPDQVEHGCLLSNRKPKNLWAVSNGLVDFDSPNLELLPHSSDWFDLYCHDYNYDLEADCPTWIAFLNQVFRNPETNEIDNESKETLKRWFGYCLLPTVSLQKMLILDGVSRSGKGVILRILEALVGKQFTSSPKLRNLGGDFGLQPLLDKRLAILSDVRLGYSADVDAILETLLSIIGEDSIDVNRKGVAASTAVSLKTKFVMACNGIPTLNDPAGAIVNRVVVLKFQNSFAGKEDTELTNNLLKELDGIFLWAIQGMQTMLRDFRLPQPKSGEDAIKNFRKQVAPIRYFVEECCHIPDENSEDNPKFQCNRNQAYLAWQAFCESIGRSKPGTKTNFVRQLTLAYPFISESRPDTKDNSPRPYVLDGIELGEWARSIKPPSDENRDGNVTDDSKKRDGAPEESKQP